MTATVEDTIRFLSERMLASILLPPFTLAPEPLRCPACGRTRLACVQFHGRDQVHEAEIRAALRLPGGPDALRALQLPHMGGRPSAPRADAR